MSTIWDIPRKDSLKKVKHIKFIKLSSDYPTFIGYAGRARSDMSRMLYSFVAIFMLFIPVSRFLNLDAESYLNSNLNQILDSNPDQSDVVHFEGRKLQRFRFESYSVSVIGPGPSGRVHGQIS